jgi:hypothetical protein
MTVILDPGNATESYTDGLSRVWRLTAGLWKTAANDPGNAGSSWTDTVARLWSATAGLWKGAAVDSGNSTTDPSWTGATQLYSTTATHWKNKDTTDLASLATMTTNYNNEVAAYNSSQASLATMTTNYNNEVTAYNNEVAAYNAVLPPASPIVLSASNAGVSGNPASGTLCTLTVDRSGYWHCSAVLHWSGNSSDGPVSTGLTVGGVGVDSESGDASGSGGANWPMSLTDTTARYVGLGGSVSVTYTLNGGTVWGSVYAVFVPTQAYPH